MGPVWLRRILIIVFALFLVLVVYKFGGNWKVIGDHSDTFFPENFDRKLTQNTKSPTPQILNNQTDFQCVDARFANLTFPICVYTSTEDRLISKVLIEGGYTDQPMVGQFMKLLKDHREVTFVDLGANLGVFSLPIAHLGIHVVAAEPSGDTFRRLAKATDLGKVGHNIDLLNYAIIDKKSDSVMKFDPTNRADTWISDNVSCADNGCVKISTITLNEIIPLIRNKKAVFKVDTQGTEIQIFTESSAGKFFDEIDVSLVLIEWDMYPGRYGGTQERRDLVDRWLQFFYGRNYTVYHPVNEQKLGPDWRGWPYDVMFKKSGLPTNTLFSI